MDRLIYEGLRSANGIKREQALHRIVDLNLEQASEYFEQLVHMWKNEDGRLRLAVADALCMSSQVADLGRSTVIKILKIEEDEVIAQRFVDFLSDAPIPQLADLSALIDEIDPDDPVSVFAVLAIGQLETGATAAIPRLLELLSAATDKDLLLVTCSVLLSFAPQPQAIRSLRALVDSDHDDQDLQALVQQLHAYWYSAT